MEKLQEQPRRAEPPAAPGIPMEAERDVAVVARDAAARATAVPLEPGVVVVNVKTTGTQSARITATPDTPMAEILTQACRDLGIRDAERYLLVARGEVVNGGSTLGQVAGEQLQEAELTMRVVKKPEAGSPACRS